MKDRLVELLKNSRTLNTLYDTEWEEAAEELLANGVIVPPCKVSTNIYFAGLDSGECLTGVIMSFCLDAAHFWFDCKYDCGLNYWHPIEDFGTRVFLTREEAEKALERRKG